MRSFLRITTIVSLLFPVVAHSEEPITRNEAHVYREEGYKLQSMGDLTGALMYYQKAAAMDPHYAEVRNDLGVIYESTNDFDRALAAYLETIEIDPGYLPAYTNLAFLYEKKGDIPNAVTYWKKRYELGTQGDYWWEVSRQHLLKLGAYPQIRKEILEEKAARLSREFVYKREQERLKLIEEARLHFDIGDRAFKERNYQIAREELKTVLSLNPPDLDLINKSRDLLKQTEKFYLKEQAQVNTQNALDYINKGDYLSAGDKLKNALSAVFSITREE